MTRVRGGLPRLAGGLLVGGRSVRMGRPKALLAFRGTSLAERAAAALRPHVDELRLLGHGPVPLALSHLPRLADAPGVAGPLAGILAALRAEPGTAWLVASCDLPLVTPDAAAWLVAQRGPGRRAILPSLAPGRVEPLFAIYEPDVSVELERIARTERAAPSRLAGREGVASPSPPPALAAAWTNANTPEELDALS